MSNFNIAIGAVGQFVAAHPELEASKVEYTVQTLLRFLKAKKQTITLPNLEAAWKQLVEAVSAMKPEAVKAGDDDVEGYRKQIESWSADEMREYCKDPEVLAAVEAVLSQPRPQKAQPAQPAPKAKATKPQLTAEELAVESMSADAFKKALQDPAKARGIERILAAAAAKRRNGQ